MHVVEIEGENIMKVDGEKRWSDVTLSAMVTLENDSKAKHE
jgi:hypothetical protein